MFVDAKYIDRLMNSLFETEGYRKGYHGINPNFGWV